MVLGRKAYRRRAPVKKRIYKRKYKLRRPIGSGAMARRYFKLRYVARFTPVSATDVSYAVFNDRPDTGDSDWTSIASLFDEYRLCALKVKWIPRYTTALTDAVTANTYSPMFVYHDVNTPNAPVSNDADEAAADSLNYENCKVKNFYRPWSYYRKMQRNIRIDTTRTSVTTSVRGYQAT